MKEIREQFLAELAKAQTVQEVDELRIRYLGRKGTITTLAKTTDFSKLSAEEKRQFGGQLNELKNLAGKSAAQADLERRLDAWWPGQA